MGEIALETEMTYYQVRWMYRQAIEKMRDSVKDKIENRMEGKEILPSILFVIKVMNLACSFGIIHIQLSIIAGLTYGD